LIVQAVATYVTAGMATGINGIAGSVATSLGGNAIVGSATAAAINSLSTQVISQLLESAITGNPLEFDLGDLMTNALKAGLTAGIIDGVTPEFYEALDIPGGTPLNKLTLGEQLTKNVADSLIGAGTGTLIYGDNFGDAFINNFASNTVAIGYSYVGDISQAFNLEDGSIGKIGLHAGMGCIGAELTGGECQDGAFAAGFSEFIAPLTALDPNEIDPYEIKRQEDLQLMISTVAGGTAGGVSGGDAGVDTGASIATDAYLYNRQLHQKEILWINSNAEVFAKKLYGDNPTQDQLDDSRARLAQQALRGTDKAWSYLLGDQTDLAAKEFLETNNDNLFVVQDQNEYKDGSITRDGDTTTEISSLNSDEYNNLKYFYQMNMGATTTNPLGTNRSLYEGFLNESNHIIDSIQNINGESINQFIRDFIPNTVNGILGIPDTIANTGNFIDSIAPTTNSERLDEIYNQGEAGSKTQANLTALDTMSTIGMVTGVGLAGIATTKVVINNLDDAVDDALDIEFNPVVGDGESNFLNSFFEIYSKAPDAKVEIDNLSITIANKYDGSVALSPIKSEERALQKIENDYNGDATQIKDLARNTIIVDADNINNVVSDLTNNGANIKVVSSTTDTLGYSGINATVQTKSGITAEIQVNTPEMLFAKESEIDARRLLGNDTYDEIASKTPVEGGLGHTLYEQWRVLDDNSIEAKIIAEKSRQYYDTVRKANAN
jgi:hypothetical protein